MAKLRKRKRRLNWYNISLIFFSLSLLIFLGMTLFTNSKTTELTIKIQEKNIELASLRNENTSINIEIQSLENKDRVYVIAQAANMNQIQDNVVSVVGE